MVMSYHVKLYVNIKSLLRPSLHSLLRGPQSYWLLSKQRRIKNVRKYRSVIPFSKKLIFCEIVSRQ